MEITILFGSNSGKSGSELALQKTSRRLVQTVFVFLFLLLDFSLASNAQTIAPKVHPNDLLNSDEFKSLQGRDRLLVFQKLENLIKPASSFDGPAPDYDYFIGDYKMNSSDLVLLLGEPDEKIALSIWQYNLNTNLRCRLVIGIDSDSMVSYVVVKDCL
jgi:hypothetical protein